MKTAAAARTRRARATRSAARNGKFKKFRKLNARSCLLFPIENRRGDGRGRGRSAERGTPGSGTGTGDRKIYIYHSVRGLSYVGRALKFLIIIYMRCYENIQ